MNRIFYIDHDCIEVFISGTSSAEDDKNLATALNFMIYSGFNVTLKGFDKYKRAIVEIDGVIHTVDKVNTIGSIQRFISVKHKVSLIEDYERYKKIFEILVI